MSYLKNLLLVFLATSTVSAAPWFKGATQTMLAAAAAEAKRENKTMLFNFTGSDWCGWCIKLKKEVFTQPEFEAYAAKHLVLVEIDFPKHIALAADVKQANEKLAQTLGVSGFPTVVLFNADGDQIGRARYAPGGAPVFIREISKIIGNTAQPPVANSSPDRPASRVVAREVPRFGGAATHAPVRYTNLVLKSISGTAKRRFALINDQTLTVGESAPVKLLDDRVTVRCLEIRDQSVIVAVHGQAQSQELKLPAPR